MTRQPLRFQKRWRSIQKTENYRAQDALEEAREGVQRIKAGKKHQEDLLKQQKEDELKNANGDNPEGSASNNSGTGSAKTNSNRTNVNKSNSNRKKPGVN